MIDTISVLGSIICYYRHLHYLQVAMASTVHDTCRLMHRITSLYVLACLDHSLGLPKPMILTQRGLSVWFEDMHLHEGQHMHCTQQTGTI
jgi:hypothetical protein